MRKSGYYVTYNNKEYRASRVPNTEEIKIFSMDKDEKKNSFKRDWLIKGRYFKQLLITDLQDAYYVHNYAVCKGEKIKISGQKEDRYLLSTRNPEAAKKVNLEKISPSEYEGWVRKSEIDELVEVKEPVWGFGKKDEPPNME
ncbi:hypothetical protein [Rubeoparvulum massiliense]|uniref:hypothetical protein n=1 Tax=Rubeoparvulum massiliense TaxID=1631346 RepID=UPI00065DF258|nr:hypothetical protein [Rubeoparvulum massiliense]